MLEKYLSAVTLFNLSTIFFLNENDLFFLEYFLENISRSNVTYQQILPARPA